MADSALIDDLEKQFADNPRRVFARLANEYRKAGDPGRAIEICHHHVPQQPGYISGHIVLGQALFDTGQFDEAQSAFQTALSLDPENLIALRQLGDIARETGDLEGAASWYRRLLEVDPQNEEVAEQLQALDAAVTATPSAEPVSAESEGQEQVRWGDIHPEDVHREAESAPAEALDDDTPSDNTPLPFIALAQESDEGAPAESAVLEAAAPAEASGVPAASTESDIVLDTSAIEQTAPAAETPEPLMLDIAALTPAVDTAEPVAAEPDAAPTPALIAPDAPTAAAGASDEPPPASESDESGSDASAVPADAFATETMAELYVRQGFIEKALDIYRQLARQAPDEPRFQNAIEELEHALATGAAVPAASEMEEYDAIDTAPAQVGPTIREFLSSIAARHATVRADTETSGGTNGNPSPDIDSAHRDSAPNTGEAAESGYAAPMSSPVPYTDDDEELFPGRPVASHDDVAADALAGGYGNGTAGEDDGRRGAPSRTASDEFSLDAVFRSTPSSAHQRDHGSSVSFDEFFASDAPESNGAASPHTGSGQPDANTGSSSDIEVFHAWLEGLKK